VTTLLAVLLGVGLAQSVSDVEFQLVLGHIDLLKSQVELLRSRKLSQYRLICIYKAGHSHPGHFGQNAQ